MEKELSVLERMNNWIHEITWEYRPPSESYQIVCDNYYDFKSELLTIIQKSKKEEEKQIYQSVIDVLDNGTNTCHNWCCDEDCMDHFQSLSSRIRIALINLEDDDV